MEFPPNGWAMGILISMTTTMFPWKYGNREENPVVEEEQTSRMIDCRHLDVEKATIHLNGGATLTQNAPVHLKHGENEFRIKLPRTTNLSSVRLSCLGERAIIMNAQRSEGGQKGKREEICTFRHEIRTMRRDLQVAEMERKLIDENAKKLLRTMDRVYLAMGTPHIYHMYVGNIKRMFEEEYPALCAEKAILDTSIGNLRAAIKDTEDALEKALEEDSEEVTVLLTLLTEQPCDEVIQLEYNVSLTTWRPEYDLKVDVEEDGNYKIGVSCHAMAKQSTGIDWKSSTILNFQTENIPKLIMGFEEEMGEGDAENRESRKTSNQSNNPKISTSSDDRDIPRIVEDLVDRENSVDEVELKSGVETKVPLQPYNFFVNFDIEFQFGCSPYIYGITKIAELLGNDTKITVNGCQKTTKMIDCEEDGLTKVLIGEIPPIPENIVRKTSGGKKSSFCSNCSCSNSPRRRSLFTTEPH